MQEVGLGHDLPGRIHRLLPLASQWHGGDREKPGFCRDPGWDLHLDIWDGVHAGVYDPELRRPGLCNMGDLNCKGDPRSERASL